MLTARSFIGYYISDIGVILPQCKQLVILKLMHQLFNEQDQAMSSLTFGCEPAANIMPSIQ